MAKAKLLEYGEQRNADVRMQANRGPAEPSRKDVSWPQSIREKRDS
jgi:hypothetical protein